MSRFTLYAAADGKGYLLDLQSDFLSDYATRIVAPVIDLRAYAMPATTLNPIVEVEGQAHVVQIHLMATVPRSALKKPVGMCADQSDEITRALDLLFSRVLIR